MSFDGMPMRFNVLGVCHRLWICKLFAVIDSIIFIAKLWKWAINLPYIRNDNRAKSLDNGNKIISGTCNYGLKQ